MNNYSVNEMQKRVLDTAFQVSDDYYLRLRTIDFIKGDSIYGSCNPSYRSIKIKLEYSDGELVPEMEVWRTLAHELAHLIYPNHGAEFWELNKQLVEHISKLLNKKIRPEIAFTKKGVVY